MGVISFQCHHCGYEGIDTKIHADQKKDRARLKCGNPNCNRTFMLGGDQRKKITNNLIITYIQLHLQGLADVKICEILGISRKKCASWKKDYIPLPIKKIMDERDKDEKLSDVINVDGNTAIVFKSQKQTEVKPKADRSKTKHRNINDEFVLDKKFKTEKELYDHIYKQEEEEDF
jgi:hypothetical protein